ncbi:MAG: ComF family protein [Deltaproteobacteria bacterium]|nr:ComF family protein [Deltaproteobacteria bacterium]
MLLQCIHCASLLNNYFTPLCENCGDALIKAPPLCPLCASPLCIQDLQKNTCLRPWMEEYHDLNIKSFRALYLLSGECYSVLKTWKKRHGIIFNQKVLKLDTGKINEIKNLNLQAIIPIPQTFKRSWKMGGSTTMLISKWLSKKITTPVYQLLTVSHKKQLWNTSKRQAELSLQDRLKNKIHFEWNQTFKNLNLSKILLVDDFMTTGHTLRAAAQILKLHSIEEIHIFCLGIKPLKYLTPELQHRLI